MGPVSRLATAFFDAITNGTTPHPGFADGYRVQLLIDAARRAHQQGRWIDIPRDGMKEELRA